jgi:hypothetical protein
MSPNRFFEAHLVTCPHYYPLNFLGQEISDSGKSSTLILGLVVDRVAIEIGIPLMYDRTRLDTPEKVWSLLTDAGLDSKESFVTGNYGEVKSLDSKNSGEIWDNFMKDRFIFRSWYSELNEASRQEESKKLFSRELRKLVGDDGMVQTHLRFCIAVGKRIR